MLASWKESYDKRSQHIKKQPQHFPNKGPYSQSYGFPVVMYGCESWTIKNAKHWRIDASNCSAGEDFWKSLGQPGIFVFYIISVQFGSVAQSYPTGVSALSSFLPKKSQGWSPSEWTGWISLQSKGLSRVFSNITVQKHQFFGAQLSSQSNSHIHTWPLEKP